VVVWGDGTCLRSKRVRGYVPEWAYGLGHEDVHHPEKYADPRCFGGLKGYDAWIRSVEEGTAAAFGLAYNTAVWAECRKYAVAFLHEARERLDDARLNPHLEKAVEHFEIVSRNLETVKEAYPYNPELSMDPIRADDRAQSAALALKRAKEAEVAGLEALAEIVGCLSE
jgi:hypothetical protein